MPISDHPLFERPTEAVLWRYLDLAKLLALLTRSSLWFCRADVLGDPFEGSIPAANLAVRRELYRGIPEDAWPAIARARQATVRQTYVSCWCASDIESMALWRAFSGPHGVAVRSTSDRLVRSCAAAKQDIHLGRVRYLDYDRELVGEGNIFAPFLAKRGSFAYESEVRAIFERPRDANEQGTPEVHRRPGPPGIAVPVDVSILVEEVRVSPMAPKWFGGLVEEVLTRMGLTYTVVQSDMSRDPVW